MAIKLDFGLHEQSVHLRSQRAQVLANNIANSDTPGYKARDLDFKQMLSNEIPEPIKRTNDKHMSGFIQMDSLEGLKYRTPTQPSVDGNTVEPHLEKAQYAENMQRFYASINFLNGRISSLMKSLRGE